MIRHTLNRLKIRHKLIILNLFITGIVFSLAAAVLFVTEYYSYRDLLVHDITAQVKVLATNSTASLTFNDQKSAMDTLGALIASPNVECAVIYTKVGKVFAAYRRPGEPQDPLPPFSREDRYFWSDDDLNVFQGVVLDGEKIGTIFLRSNLKKVYSLMLQHVAINLLILFLVFGLAYLLITKYQRIITEPILNLLESMRTVSRNKNYSLRAQVLNEDEIGTLAEGFNEMLTQIQERDLRLQDDIERRIRTERALSESEERLKTILESIQAGVMIIDPTTHYIVHANKMACEWIGADREKIVGSQCWQFVCPAEKGKCPITDLGQTVDNSERLLVDASGRRRDIIKTVTPIELDGKQHLLESFIDNTERKQAEDAIRSMNEELEIKVAERTAQLLEAQEELVRREKLSILGQLSGSVGHELRNPLGVMNNAVYFLKTVVPEEDGLIREYVDIIKQEIDNSQRIINDLLDFARTKTPQRRAVGVRELIGECLGRCVIPDGVAVALEIADSLPPLNVDPLQAGQVLYNLITNGVQAMPMGGRLSIGAGQPGAGAIAISVEDSGEGISPENMKRLFHPLFTTKARGIGLGLVVSRNLTEANGGRLEVESWVGEGTRFTVTLPAMKESS